MTNALKVVQVGSDPFASDLNQIINTLNGSIDVGPLNLASSQSTPSAPTVASGSSGNLNGAYLYKIVLITGWKQSDGSYYVSGFAPSTESASITITNAQGSLSGISTGTSPVIGRAIYRTAAGGASGSEKFVGVIWDNVTTTFTDNVADANLGTGMPSSSSVPAVYGTSIPSSVPTSNTTGTSLNISPSSFGTNGYQALSNGLILQWLEYDAASTNFTSGTKQTFNFNWPIAFPTACLSGLGNLVGGVSYAAYTNFQTNNFSKTGGSADITIGNTATYSPIFKVWGIGY